MARGSRLTIFLAGAALGTVAGILFAPQEGKKTRERLAEEARRLWEDGSAEDRIRAKAGDIARSVREFARTSGERIEEGREKILTAIERSETALSGVVRRARSGKGLEEGADLAAAPAAGEEIRPS